MAVVMPNDLLKSEQWIKKWETEHRQKKAPSALPLTKVATDGNTTSGSIMLEFATSLVQEGTVATLTEALSQVHAQHPSLWATHRAQMRKRISGGDAA
jgi:hypothetical protein